MIDQVLGNYRIAAKLGGGGMGVVYVAEHTLIGRKAAVKMLHPEMSTNPDLVKRFFNEAKSSSLVKHPGIVDVFDFGYHADGTAYIIMEFLEGESVGGLLRRAQPSVGTALAITRQVAAAVGAAHAHGIVHRDLKPDNVFLVPDREQAGGIRVKVLDFGIAKLASDPSSASATKTGSMMGTPLYMSPEQCRGAGKVDHRADIYALGCLLFELCCGRPPFLGEGVGEIIGAHLHVAPPAPSSLGVMLAPELEQLILQMIAKAAAERPQSMDDVIATLDRLMQAEPASSIPFAARRSSPAIVPEALASTLGSSAGQQAPAAKRPRRTGLLLGGMGGVAVAGVVAFVVASGSERTPDPQPVANVVVPPDSAAPPPPSPVPEPAIEQPSALSAARASTNVPPPPPKDAFDEHLETARQAFAAGQYARAVTAAEQALGLRRADPAALALVVRAACKLEDSAKAIRHAKYVAAARRKALVTECTADGVALDPEAFAWTDGATRKWTGAWANQGWRFTFTLELTRNALELGGAFTWRLDEAPPDQRQDNVGQSAKEFLRGTYEPAAGRVRVRGVGMSAPDVIGLDSYDLKIAADGLISGKTRTNAGNWSGRISAILVK